MRKSKVKALWKYQKSKPLWIKSGKTEENSSMECHEGEIKVWSRPSGKEGWKDSPLRELDGPLSLEEMSNLQNTSRSTWSELCSGRITSRTKEDIEQYSHSLVLQRLRWQRQSSWTPSQSFLVWLEKQASRRMSRDMDQVSSTTQTKSWKIIEDPVVPLERNLNGHPLAAFFGKEKVQRCYLKRDGKMYQHENVFTCTRSPDYFCRCMWVWKNVGKADHGSQVENSAIEFDFEDPTASIDQARKERQRLIPKRFNPKPGCSRGWQRQWRLTKKIRRKKIFIGKDHFFCSCDMEGHAETCVVRYCELSKKDVSSLQRVATSCIDDHRYCWKIMKQRESSLRYVFKLSCNAWNCQELDD